MAQYNFTSHRLFVEHPLAEGARFALNREQANYLVNVLRLAEGDGFLLFNGRDGEWGARLAGGSRKSPEVLVGQRLRPQTPATDLWYLFAPIKSARLDYMVQKAVEMGVSRLAPVITRRTVATRVNLERMRANVVEAAEQCGVLALPDVVDDMPLARALADWPAGRTLIFADEDAEGTDPLTALATVAPGSPLAVIVGPEGGFDPAERQDLLRLAGVVRLSLGPRILRADTAAVAVLTLVQAALGDFRS